MNKYVMVFLIALVVSLAMTPLARKLAFKIGAIDVPKDDRRVHKTPIPRLGGLAIYLGFVVSVLFMLPMSKAIAGMLIGGTLIVAMGIVDDIKPLSAKTKLAGQIVCAIILVYSGLRIGKFNIPFMEDTAIYLSFLSIPVTIFWIVGITNTVNLIDGLDGLAAGVSMIAALSLSYVAHINDLHWIPWAVEANGGSSAAIMTLAIAGACLGFLPYNFNPAKIFMGDTGSLFLGYMLSAISIYGAIKGATALATFVPVLALGLPIFDTAFAILRRALNGKPIMEPDKGHLHHRLLSTGMGQKRTVLVLYTISATLGLSAGFMSSSKMIDALAILLVASGMMYMTIGIPRFQKQKSTLKE